MACMLGHALHVSAHSCSYRINKVMNDKLQATEIQFKNADGKYTKERFTFEHVLAHFKPLT